MVKVSCGSHPETALVETRFTDVASTEIHIEGGIGLDKSATSPVQKLRLQTASFGKSLKGKVKPMTGPVRSLLDVTQVDPSDELRRSP